MLKKFILVVILLFSFACQSNKPSYLLILGNQINQIETKKLFNEDINDSFLMRKGYTSYLYSMVEQNAKNIKTSETLMDTIEHANRIYIYLGTQEFLRGIQITKEKILLDQDVLETQSELFSYYYFLLLEEIRLSYEGEIILLSPYIELYTQDKETINALDNAFLSFYNVIEEVSNYFSCSYIDLRELSLFLNEENQLNDEAISFLKNRINNG